MQLEKRLQGASSRFEFHGTAGNAAATWSTSPLAGAPHIGKNLGNKAGEIARGMK